MPKRTKKNPRRDRRPNVFVQSERPAQVLQDDPESNNGEQAAQAVAPAPAISAVPDANRTRSTSRAQRRTRSEVYARSFPREIRKMGVLTGGMVIALVVLSFVL